MDRTRKTPSDDMVLIISQRSINCDELISFSFITVIVFSHRSLNQVFFDNWHIERKEKNVSHERLIKSLIFRVLVILFSLMMMTSFSSRLDRTNIRFHHFISFFFSSL